MITQLEIKNFRGFSEYKIDDVGQVNLLVGTNNCGKTSVLEAIHLLKSRGDVAVLFSILTQRGEQVQYDNSSLRRVGVDLCRLFYGFQLTPKSSFSISCTDNVIEMLSATIQQMEADQLPFTELDEKDKPDFSDRYKIYISWNNGDGGKNKGYPFSPSGGVSYDMIRRSYFRSEQVDDDNIKFVPASSLLPKKVVTLYENIALLPDEELALDAVRIIEPDIILPFQSRQVLTGIQQNEYPLLLAAAWDDCGKPAAC